jgi:EmrB/QacA subfamily drug resistance transporter
MTNLDSTVVNVSLSALGTELHAPLTQIQWVTTGYLLALALMLPLSGWLVDRVGTKPVYLGCFATFTLASLLCGSANTALALIAFRVLQGMAGGLLAPMAQMMVARFAGPHIARVMGLMVVPILIGPILGPSLAGLILQHASWRWLFFINLPIGLLALVLALWLIPPDEPRSAATPRRPFDLPGFLLLSPTLVLLLYCLERLSTGRAGTGPASTLAYLGLALALVLMALFLRHARRRGPASILDLALFRIPSFAAATAVQFFGNACIFGGQMLMPLYLLLVCRRSPADTGLLLGATGIGMLCSYPTMGPLSQRFGSRTVSTAGTLLTFAAILPFALAGDRSLPVPFLCAVLFLRGVGSGSVGIPSIAAAYSAIPKPLIPVATTALNIVQRLGGPVATTLLTIALHASGDQPAHHGTSSPHAFLLTFRLLALFHLLTILAALRLPVRAQHAAPKPA